MFKVSKLADYAVVLMCDLAADRTVPRSASSLAQATLIPKETARKVLKKLLGAGLLEADRGAQGGYYLSREAQQIRLSDMVVAVDSQLQITDCQSYQALCPAKNTCLMRPHWQRINGLFLMIMQQITLRDLLTGSNDSGLWSLSSSFVQQLQDMGYVKEAI